LSSDAAVDSDRARWHNPRDAARTWPELVGGVLGWVLLGWSTSTTATYSSTGAVTGITSHTMFGWTAVPGVVAVGIGVACATCAHFVWHLLKTD
jgi:hypothetical protein